MKLAAALTFVALNFYIYVYLANEEVLPPRETFESFPLEVADWRCRGNEEMDAKALRILGATDYWICTYLS